jgi:hypothetical protein
MARYHEILADKARANRAVKAAQARANELSKRATAMKKVAKSK